MRWQRGRRPQRRYEGLGALDGAAAGVQWQRLFDEIGAAPQQVKQLHPRVSDRPLPRAAAAAAGGAEAGSGDGGGGGADAFGGALGLDGQSDAAGGGAEAVAEFLVVGPTTLDWQRRLGVEGDGPPAGR